MIMNEMIMTKMLQTMDGIKNFGRFYAALRQLPDVVDADETKRVLVMQYTGNRTDSLREMLAEEYDVCCRRMEELARDKAELRRRRSVCLRQMQRMGVDTTDWARVNDFCRHPRICGKPFAWLGVSELDALSRKLRAIDRNGGLRVRQEKKTYMFNFYCCPVKLKSAR